MRWRRPTLPRCSTGSTGRCGISSPTRWRRCCSPAGGRPRPRRSGDGGFSMLMAEFLTAIQDNLPVKIVINNNSLGEILWEQMVLGYPEHGVRFGQPESDFAAWAHACHGFGAKVTKP